LLGWEISVSSLNPPGEGAGGLASDGPKGCWLITPVGTSCKMRNHGYHFFRGGVNSGPQKGCWLAPCWLPDWTLRARFDVNIETHKVMVGGGPQAPPPPSSAYGVARPPLLPFYRSLPQGGLRSAVRKALPPPPSPSLRFPGVGAADSPPVPYGGRGPARRPPRAAPSLGGRPLRQAPPRAGPRPSRC